MNQKGITLVELLVSFSIITILSLGLFKATLSIEEKQMINITKNNFVSFNSIINNSIQNDFLTKEINSFTQCGTNCYEIKYKGNEIKKLELNKDKKIISYGDVKEKLPNNYFFYDDINLIKYTSSDNENNSYILLNIPIRSNFNSNKKDIKIMYQYNGTDILKTNFKSYIENLYNTKASENGLVKDDTVDHNIRYVGSNNVVKNYVSFDGDMWRIIGIIDGKVKLVKEKSLGTYSYDTSPSDKNNGAGYNIWETIEGKTKPDGTTKADINILLNEGYYGGTYPSACYGGGSNANKACPTTYINPTLKTMVDENAEWKFGSVKTDLNNVLSVYEYEIGENIYSEHKELTSTKWTGAVALISPSDYLLAGKYEYCLNDENNYTTENCRNNNWMYKYISIWLNNAIIEYNSVALHRSSFGSINNYFVYSSLDVIPSVYLKSTTLIESGSGTSTDPYILSIN